MFEFKNIQQLTTKFSDEAVCREYLEYLLWKGNPICPHCGYAHPYQLKDGKTYRCKSSLCRKDFTVTVGTIFENSKVPLSKWFIAIYLCINHKKGISSLQLAKDISVTRRTAWFMLHRIREMVKPKEEVVLKGTVMIDETYVGGKEKNKSKYKRMQVYAGEREINKTPVFGLIQKDGAALMHVVNDARAETLRPIINEKVDKESIIISDGAVVHTGLNATFSNHIIVNHSIGEYVNGDYTTNHIESLFAILKRTIIGTYHSISSKHLQRYCEEVKHRYNTRKIKDNERFVFTLGNSTGRLKYNQLIGKINNLAS